MAQSSDEGRSEGSGWYGLTLLNKTAVREREGGRKGPARPRCPPHRPVSQRQRWRRHLVRALSAGVNRAQEAFDL